MNLFKYHSNPETLHSYDKRKTFEPIIKTKLESLHYKHKDDIKQAFDKTELKTIMANGKLASLYARLLEKRIPEAEPAILQNVVAAFDYWSMVLNPGTGKKYNSSPTGTTFIIADRWPEAEKLFITNAWVAANYAILIDERWPEAEPLIAKHPNASISYVEHILKKKWPEAEERIAKDMWMTGRYNMVLKDLRYSDDELIQ